jgi:hypothetical protein
MYDKQLDPEHPCKQLESPPLEGQHYDPTGFEKLRELRKEFNSLPVCWYSFIGYQIFILGFVPLAILIIPPLSFLLYGAANDFWWTLVKWAVSLFGSGAALCAAGAAINKQHHEIPVEYAATLRTHVNSVLSRKHELMKEKTPSVNVVGASFINSPFVAGNGNSLAVAINGDASIASTGATAAELLQRIDALIAELTSQAESSNQARNLVAELAELKLLLDRPQENRSRIGQIAKNFGEVARTLGDLAEPVRVILSLVSKLT